MSILHLLGDSPPLILPFPQARKFMKVRLGFIQNNRSSAPPIVMMDGEASEGYLLFWLKSLLN